MKNVLIYAMNFNEARITENIENIFSGRSFVITSNEKNFNITYKKIFGSESFRIKITDIGGPSYILMKETMVRLFSQRTCEDENIRGFLLNYLDKAQAFVEIECEKDYSGLLDELFIKLTSSFNGAALLENGTLIDACGMVILFEDGTLGDSDLLNQRKGYSPDDSDSLSQRGGSLPDLSAVKLAENFKFPTKDEIIGRACALLLISGYASDVSMSEPIKESRAFYEGLIKKYEIGEYLSEKELAFLYKDNISIEECFEQIYDFDKAAVLMWSLSLADCEMLSPYGENVDFNSLLSVLASFGDFDALYDSSKIKSSGELLNLANKLYGEYMETADERLRKAIKMKYAGILWLCGN